MVGIKGLGVVGGLGALAMSGRAHFIPDLDEDSGDVAGVERCQDQCLEPDGTLRRAEDDARDAH
jgi:hypothetical protein